MGTVKAVCTSTVKGIQKSEQASVALLPDHGIVGDAHAGPWHRQVSLLSFEQIEAFKDRGAEPLGTRFECGDALLELTQVGKECHAHCAIYHQMGDCIMPREGVFCKVLRGGTVSAGDSIQIVA